MTTDPWPPEGTRVRIVDKSVAKNHTGVLLGDGGCKWEGRRWVRLDSPYNNWTWQVERHEIEVIDET